MPNKNKKYVKGYELEQDIVNACKKRGFIFAQRTAGSHSVADVIGIIPNGTVILFQAKSTEKYLNKGLTDILKGDNVQKLLELPDNIIKVLVIKEKSGNKRLTHFYKYDYTNNKWVKINFTI
jgi:Holliday junction resolvase